MALSEVRFGYGLVGLCRRKTLKKLILTGPQDEPPTGQEFCFGIRRSSRGADDGIGRAAEAEKVDVSGYKLGDWVLSLVQTLCRAKA